MSAPKAKYTPGPIVVKPDFRMANVYRLWDEDENYPADTTVGAMEANSRLFAQAPAMAELLRRLDRWEGSMIDASEIQRDTREILAAIDGAA